MRPPKASAIMAALAGVGRPRCLSTVRQWTSGVLPVPHWALVAISEETGCDLGVLTRELARRWEAKQRTETQ